MTAPPADAWTRARNCRWSAVDAVEAEPVGPREMYLAALLVCTRREPGRKPCVCLLLSGENCTLFEEAPR